MQDRQTSDVRGWNRTHDVNPSAVTTQWQRRKTRRVAEHREGKQEGQTARTGRMRRTATVKEGRGMRENTALPASALAAGTAGVTTAAATSTAATTAGAGEIAVTVGTATAVAAEAAAAAAAAGEALAAVDPRHMRQRIGRVTGRNIGQQAMTAQKGKTKLWK